MQFRLIGGLTCEQVQTSWDHFPLKNEEDDARRFPPHFLVDAGSCYNVITRRRHKIASFWVLVTWCAGTNNEEDLVGESRYTRF